MHRDRHGPGTGLPLPLPLGRGTCGSEEAQVSSVPPEVEQRSSPEPGPPPGAPLWVDLSLSYEAEHGEEGCGPAPSGGADPPSVSFNVTTMEAATAAENGGGGTVEVPKHEDGGAPIPKGPCANKINESTSASSDRRSSLVERGTFNLSVVNLTYRAKSKKSWASWGACRRVKRSAVAAEDQVPQGSGLQPLDAMETGSFQSVAPHVGDGQSPPLANTTTICHAPSKTSLLQPGASLRIPAPAGGECLKEQEDEEEGEEEQILSNAPYSCCSFWGPESQPGAAASGKVLLSGVSAEAKHGEILAVVGPSGAGKTTFLDAVAGRIRASSLEGEILLNGKRVDSTFRRISGYVMQDDQLFPMLTVRETLSFSARLRLPNSLRKERKDARVEEVIQELGLSSCANTMVGNDEVRGLSGGEKRRLSIGVDLLHDPAVLFLDEPTSGLDSAAAHSVVHILRESAVYGRRTIVLTIHQPSFRILELIHKYLILAQGRVVYHGPYRGMAHHFRLFEGQPPVEQANGLEYALDVVERTQKHEGGLRALIKFSEGKSLAGSHRAGGGGGISDTAEVASEPEYATGFLSEFVVLLDRSLRNILRTKELFLLRVVTFLFAGILVGSLFYQAHVSATGIRDRVSFFTFILLAYLITSVEALPIFLEERLIYIRETSRGAYRTSSYVLAGTVAFIPFLFVTALAGSVVPYFMVGLHSGAGGFLMFLLAAFLTLAVANSFVLFVAGFVPNFAIGVTISTATIAGFFLAAGVLIEPSRIPSFWMWMNWLSIFKYPFQMLMVNEFGSLGDTCWSYVGSSQDPSTPCVVTSQQVLLTYELASGRVWIPAIIMLAFFIGYRALFYILLRMHTCAVRR